MGPGVSQTRRGLRAGTRHDPGRAMDGGAPTHPERDIQMEAVVVDPEKRNGGRKWFCSEHGHATVPLPPGPHRHPLVAVPQRQA